MKTLHCRLEADHWYGHSSAVSQTGELFSEYVQLFAYPSEFKFQLIFTNLFGTMSFMQHNELENRRCHTVIGVTVFVRATFGSSESDHNVTYKRSTINNNNAAFFSSWHPIERFSGSHHQCDQSFMKRLTFLKDFIFSFSFCF